MAIRLEEYEYELPKERIAQFPVEPRHDSKLLLFNSGNIQHKSFKSISEHLDANSLLVFNDTKVIPARLYFRKQTGAIIEIFLLEPISPSKEVVQAMEAKGSSVWQCMIGNLKKWKNDEVLKLQIEDFVLNAELVDKELRQVKFTWDPSQKPMVEVIQKSGKIPIPPYLERQAIESDSEHYQTVYAKNDGAVAAPTAGLHFTQEVFNALESKGIKKSFVTLHVGAGTFQPVKEREDVTLHEMHSEQFMVDLSTLKSISASIGKISVVGTTSMRTLESLYWLGNKFDKGHPVFHVSKLEPYRTDIKIDVKQAIDKLIRYLEENELDKLHGTTEIMIFPGYDFKICNQLITNFHQPGSTLMLLIAAFVGEDWKKIYAYALENDFRFLSYGDSSLLTPNKQ
jgi:S-adenosylmethionine:tRNA ribosyltransferase-isomerase